MPGGRVLAAGHRDHAGPVGAELRVRSAKCAPGASHAAPRPGSLAPGAHAVCGAPSVSSELLQVSFLLSAAMLRSVQAAISSGVHGRKGPAT